MRLGLGLAFNRRQQGRQGFYVGRDMLLATHEGRPFMTHTGATLITDQVVNDIVTNESRMLMSHTGAGFISARKGT